ncbi:FimV/HubP family polar landmark protein [Pleionea mediterranea]|uniref:Pilus assembly protein FimV n=1 Tax=Pleionea mediterranea TaxID=523701 RepID=A0A316FJM8_9GAMM|nr:FimV/HubP family polar landmark protein [Pleionea mediterranea]PWK49118.1 pilus assembly protein FimV [Pleionea mediterranea]
MFRKLSLVLVSVLVAFSLGVHALGLGEIKLKSGLNQPLKAEIELFSPEGMSEFEVAASLASMAEFEKAGIDYFGYLKNIRFKTVKHSEEVLVIELSTREPIKEPFLNFLVELNWPKGRMLREYTVLLDPPVFSNSSSSTVTQAETAKPRQAQTAPQTVQQTRQPAVTRQPSNTSETVFSDSSYGPVGNAETLWSIAGKVRPSNATIHQTLVALFRANPDAFVNQNINLLKKGAVLEIPDASQIASTPHRAALKDMVARLRGDNTSDSVLDTSGQQASNQSARRSGDRLKLATPDSGTGDASGTGSNLDGQQVNRLKSQLAETKEAAATLEAENEELRRKLQSALSQIEQSGDNALDISSTEGAALANQDSVFKNTDDSDTQQSLDDESTGTDDASIEDEGMAAGNTQQSSDDSSDMGTEQSGLDSSNTDSNDAMTDQETASDSSPTKKTTPPSSLSTPPSSSSILDDPLYLYGGIALIVVLLGAFAVFWKMRQRMSDEEYQDDLVVSAGGSSFDTEESMDMPDGDDLLSDFDSDDVFEGDESTAEADPLGEADIYIAYGKYDQAEKLLKDAIDSHPERTDLKVKLLECFAEAKDKDSFEATENEFNNSFDNDSARQVSEIKSQAWPGESTVDDEFELPSTEEIFGDSDTSSSKDDFDDDFSLDDLDTESDVSLDDTDEQPSISGEEESFDTDELDFDIEDQASDDDKADAGSDDAFSLDEDLLDLESEKDSASDDDFSLDMDDDTTKQAGSDDDSFSLDSDSDDDAIDLSDDIDMDLDSDDFNLDEDDSMDDELMDGTDEASTKLDLARAYIDMGDAEGAKEILNEVVEEGGEAHKSEALSLLEKL